MQSFFTVKITWIPSTINHVGLASEEDTLSCFIVIRKPRSSDKSTCASYESSSKITYCTCELKLAFAPP